MRFRFSRQEAALIGITVIWGATFLIIQAAMQVSDPLFFVGLRFASAGLLGAVLFRPALHRLTKTEWLASLSIGFGLFLGYGLQTWGLQSIASSQSAFITALYVPLVPLLQWLIWQRLPTRRQTIGIILAFIGLMLLAGPEQGQISFSAGEWATLLGAVIMAAEIILIAYFAPKVNIQRVTVMQLLLAGILAFISMPFANEAIPEFSWVWVSAALGLGAASCLIQLTMNWAQRKVDANRATVIYASEPVWAGLFGRLAGERLPVLALVGAALIVISVLSGERRARKTKAINRFKNRTLSGKKRS